jgi:hydroxymethylbilane synthase
LATGLAAVNHVTTQVNTTAERLVLARLEAGCSAPIGATAVVDELVFLTATVYAPDGSAKLTSSHAATPESNQLRHLLEAADDIAGRVAAELLADGAADLAPLGTAS